MNRTNQPFANAVKHYPNFKALFRQFCDAAAKQLNGNAQLPLVSFSVMSDGNSASLHALGRTFDISLRFVILDNIPWGVLEVTVPGETKEPVRLFHVLFDELGNVKDTLDNSAPARGSFQSSESLANFLDQVVEKYFSYLQNLKGLRAPMQISPDLKGM